MTKTNEYEIVLPSGKFAACSNINVADWLSALTCSDSTQTMVVLINRCVTIDSRALTVTEIMQLPLEDYWPIVNMVSNKIEQARLTKDGVK